MNLQNYYETVMQLSHGIVVTLDLKGAIIHGNSELEALSGYSMQELAGRDWFETFIPEEERGTARQAIFEQTRLREVTAVAGIITAKDGDVVYVDWNLKPLTDSDGEIVSVLCVGQDVTDHMLREKGLERERFTLMERNKELNCLYEISLAMTDIEQELGDMLGRVVELLPSAFQHPKTTGVRLDVDDLVWMTDGYGETANMLREPLVIGRERRGTLSVAVEGSGNGRSPFIEDEKDLLKTAAQQVSFIIGKKESLDARKTLEAQLRQSDRLAKIGQFSAGVAHEINEPLANILGFAELALQTSGLPEQVQSDLGSIVDSSLHAREVIRKLMFFGRQLPPQLLAIDLNEVVDQALRIIESGARRSSVVIKRDYDSSLPSIKADPQHIKQVVVNLAANAIQAMESGGALTVRTATHETDAYIIVEDTGPGMEPDILKQIFTPFFTTKDVDKGTGLGLSVVHGIVKGHEGFIQVDSTPGKGTRVEVAFPCPACTKGAK